MLKTINNKVWKANCSKSYQSSKRIKI